jgi:hypothetical protein
MNDELNRWLDGEGSREDLPAELREQAELWDRLARTRRSDIGPAPEWIAARVMRDIPSGRPGPVTRAFGALRWLARPRTVRVRPVTVGAFAAAGLAALLLWPGTPAPIVPAESGVTRAAGAPAADGQVYVQFVYVAPEAGAVSVAGDFNEWSEQGFTLRDPDGDGVWTGHLPLTPGLHKYMFVVDGEWVTDPQAERYIDDGFGNRNALISVVPPGNKI